MEDQGFTRIKEIKKLLSSNSFELNNFEYKAKPIRAAKSIFEKKILTSFKNSKQTELEKKYLHKEELRKLLSSISEVRELPAAILKLPHLNSFESCHILVHEKGKPVGQNYLALHGENEETKLIAVQNFNSLFNLVKKSKNKIFSQSLTLKDDLAVVGNFLAKDIDLKNISQLRYRYSSELQNATIEVHSGSLRGKLISTLQYNATGSWNTFVEKSTPISDPGGKNDLYFVWVKKTKPNRDLIGLDWVQFVK